MAEIHWPVDEKLPRRSSSIGCNRRITQKTCTPYRGGGGCNTVALPQELGRPLGGKNPAALAQEDGSPFAVNENDQLVPKVSSDNTGQRRVGPDAQLVVSAQLRAVLASIRKTLPTAPQPVPNDPLVSQQTGH